MINIVLYAPEIPQNTGNIMRTCAATGAKLHLIKPLGFNLDEKSIKRSGANYIEFCDYTIYENFDEFEKQNEGEYYFLTRYGKKTHTEFDFKQKNKKIYLILGSESSGIPKEILKNHLDRCMRIPMNDNVRSLNLSNCAAIILYETLRQQDYNDLLREEPFKGANYLSE